MSDIVERLREHVADRGGPSMSNGAWEMMLEAADEIDRQRALAWKYLQEIGAQTRRAEAAEGVLTMVKDDPPMSGVAPARL